MRISDCGSDVCSSDLSGLNSRTDSREFDTKRRGVADMPGGCMPISGTGACKWCRLQPACRPARGHLAIAIDIRQEVHLAPVEPFDRDSADLATFTDQTVDR